MPARFRNRVPHSCAARMPYLPPFHESGSDHVPKGNVVSLGVGSGILLVQKCHWFTVLEHPVGVAEGFGQLDDLVWVPV